jgi:putative DNA methylase
MIPAHCKRLIEVDLPIRKVSENSRREKSFPIPRGHISTMHIWWARRPLAACRAVVLASLLPDPADESCPEVFREKAWKLLRPLGRNQSETSTELRKALLDFIADFCEWK